MRYSIIGATVVQVKAVGVVDVKQPHNIPVIFAELTPNQVKQLRDKGALVEEVGQTKSAPLIIGEITPPKPVEAAPTYYTQEMIEVAGLEKLRGITVPPLYGDGFNLAIIGTGIRGDHELIYGRVIYNKSYILGSSYDDGFNHDTGVASIALVVAPHCGLLNMKVLGSKGEGTEEQVVEAIDDCITMQESSPDIAPTVINLSLGALDDGNPNTPMRLACRVAIEKGIWVVASAGNAGPANYSITSPACERYVAAVGSCSPDPFVISDFSSRGPTIEGLTKPDTVFFGENLILASSASKTATIAKSGTSFAAPFVSGFCLLYLQAMLAYGGVSFPEPKPPEIHPPTIYPVSAQEMIDEHLVNVTVKPQGALTIKDNDYGNGVILGDLIIAQFRVVPVIDISSIMGMVSPILAMSMLGMVILPASKAFR